MIGVGNIPTFNRLLVKFLRTVIDIDRPAFLLNQKHYHNLHTESVVTEALQHKETYRKTSDSFLVIISSISVCRLHANTWRVKTRISLHTILIKP